MANTKVVGSNTPKKRFFRFLMVILIIGLCLLMLSPFIWMIGASLKKEADVQDFCAVISIPLPEKGNPRRIWYSEDMI